MRVVSGRIQCPKDLADAERSLVPRTVRQRPVCDYAEARVWEALGGGWHCLHGCFCDRGVSVEWHEFECDKPLDWARSFHPGGVELCLNVSGHARLSCGKESVLLEPMTALFYATPDDSLSAWRLPGEQHRFLTMEYSRGFLECHLTGNEGKLEPVVVRVLRQEDGAGVFGLPRRLSARWRRGIEKLRAPPVEGAAAVPWYQGKALEWMAELFFAPEEAGGAVSRRQHVARQRVARTVEILGQRLAEPPTLQELGREVGCSPYYLSRVFSTEMGMTLSQYLRQMRMERAAELLKSGRCNVTEAALEVGYNSLSHFSHAFRETLGCCPGLYPLGVDRSGVGKPVVAPSGECAVENPRRATS